jgi:hypothetical protein
VNGLCSEKFQFISLRRRIVTADLWSPIFDCAAPAPIPRKFFLRLAHPALGEAKAAIGR